MTVMGVKRGEWEGEEVCRGGATSTLMPFDTDEVQGMGRDELT